MAAVHIAGMTSRPRLSALWVGLCSLVWLSTAVPAQEAPVPRRPLIGYVRDTLGVPLEGVSVSIPGMMVFSDARGRFDLSTGEIGQVTVQFRLIGYRPITLPLTSRNRAWDTVFVQMDPTPPQLAEVNVVESRTRAALGLRNFDERRKRGIGQFITRAEIVERGSYRLSDVIRTKRGVVVVRGTRVRFSAYVGARSTLCQPDIWLDGARTHGMEVDELASNTVEAIELYPYFSTIPVEFQPVGANTTPCGTIVIWTRIPNGRDP
jgi:hypothetical protein